MIIKRVENDEEMLGRAYVHYRTWHDTYTGIIDQSYLDRLTLKKCEDIAFSITDGIFIAKEDDEVRAFISYGRCRDEDLSDAGEIYAVYVLKEYQKQGIGKRLLDRSFEELDCFPVIAVWVLKDNSEAIDFYRNYGFAADGCQRDINLVTAVTEIRMICDRQEHK